MEVSLTAKTNAICLFGRSPSLQCAKIDPLKTGFHVAQYWRNFRWVVDQRATAIWDFFQPKIKKRKKKQLWKNFLYFSKKIVFLIFGKCNFLALSLKNFLYFFQKKKFLYFRRELGKPEKYKFLVFFLYFGKWKYVAPNLKNS